MQIETLKVTGMSSEASAALVQQALAGIRGVHNVDVSYADQNVVVKFDEQKTARQEMLTVLAKAGFSREEQKDMTKKQGGCCGGCCS